MKLIDVTDCAESCSCATFRALEAATEAGRFAVTVAGRRLEANQAVIFALVDQTQKSVWVVIRQYGQHDYRIIESTGKIPGFNEKTLLELAIACIQAVRFKHIHG